MKIRIRQLRSIIKEALDETGQGDFKVGDWIKLASGGVHELLGFEEQSYKGTPYTLAKVRTVDGTRSQRSDVMFQGARLATPEEVEKAKTDTEAERSWMAKNIDTSREGT